MVLEEEMVSGSIELKHGDEVYFGRGEDETLMGNALPHHPDMQSSTGYASHSAH